MTLSRRDKRALAVLAAAAAVSLAVHFAPSGGEQPATVGVSTSIPMAERRLARLRQLAASVPAMETALQRATTEVEDREKGLLQADTAPQAQALLLQILRRVGAAQAPPLEIRSVEMGQVRPLGEDYGEAIVSVSFDCRIEQLVNLLADMTAQPEMVAANELRINTGDQKQKMLTVRLTVSGVVPRRLVPEKKGLGSL